MITNRHRAQTVRILEMITHVKTGIDQEQSRAADRQVRQTVENILADVDARGDRAVRDYSEKFDRWAPADFRLSQQEIDALMSSVDPMALQDIKFAQAQVRRFAEAQRGALRDIEVETLPGVTLGHKNIPVQSVGCYVPGGRYPMIASAHMSIVPPKWPVCRGLRRAPRRSAALRTRRPSPRWLSAVLMRFTCSVVFRLSLPWGSGPSQSSRSTCWLGRAMRMWPKPSVSSSAAWASIFWLARPKSS